MKYIKSDDKQPFKRTRMWLKLILLAQQCIQAYNDEWFMFNFCVQEIALPAILNREKMQINIR